MKTETPDYATMEAGPAMDALVAERVMGWRPIKQIRPNEHWLFERSENGKTEFVHVGFCRTVSTWNPSTQYTATLDVLAKIGQQAGNRCPAAICRAALLAVARNGGAA